MQNTSKRNENRNIAIIDHNQFSCMLSWKMRLASRYYRDYSNIVLMKCAEKSEAEVSSYWMASISRNNHAQMCSVEKVFLKISENSQENTCAWVFFLIMK